MSLRRHHKCKRQFSSLAGDRFAAGLFRVLSSICFWSLAAAVCSSNMNRFLPLRLLGLREKSENQCAGKISRADNQFWWRIFTEQFSFLRPFRAVQELDFRILIYTRFSIIFFESLLVKNARSSNEHTFNKFSQNSVARRRSSQCDRALYRCRYV